MKQHVLEAVAIAMITTGLGILLILFPIEIHKPTLPIRIGVLFVVALFIIKLAPKVKSTASSCRLLVHACAFYQSKQKLEEVPVQRSELQQYFAWIEKKLSRLIEYEELECGLSGIKRGPLVVTLRLKLINPSHKDLQKLMRLGPTLAQILQVEAVRVADTAQGIMIEIPSPMPCTPNGALLSHHTAAFNIAIGVDTFSSPIYINMQDHGAVFWVGPSRRGKTQSIKSTLYAVIKANNARVAFVICASPAKVQKDWGVFHSISGCLGIASSKAEIAAATSWLVEYMNSGEARPTILVIDDLPSILKAVPSIQEDLIDIASMGAGLGIHFWAGTQGAGSKRMSGGTEIENNVTARIVYKPSTSRTGSQSAGLGGLDLHQLSSAKGDALALIDGVATRIATAWISNSDIALLPSAEGSAPPWRNHPKPGESQSKPPKTTLNQVEPGVAYIQNSDTPERFERIDTDALEPVLKPVLEPPNQMSQIDQYVYYLATLTNEQLKSENLGFDGSSFPSPDEQRIVMLAYQISATLNKACFICYGYKNPKIISYVNSIIQSVSTEMTTNRDADIEIPEEINLDTPEGQLLFRKLQESGAIRLPDIEGLIEEGDV